MAGQPYPVTQPIGAKINPDGSVNANTTAMGKQGRPTTAMWADRSGKITTGGTSQTVMASNANRKRIFIQNPPYATENLFFNFAGPSTTSTASTTSFCLAIGQFYDSRQGPVSMELVTINASTSGHVFIAKEM